MKNRDIEIHVLYVVNAILILSLISLIFILINSDFKFDLNGQFFTTVLTIVGTIAGVIVGSTMSNKNSEKILEKTLEHNYILSIEEFRGLYVDWNEKFIKLFGAFKMLKGHNVNLKDKDLFIAEIHHKSSEILTKLKESNIPADYKETMGQMSLLISKVKIEADEIYYSKSNQFSDAEKEQNISRFYKESNSNMDDLDKIHEETKRKLLL